MEVMPFGKPLAAKPYQGWPVPRANHVRVDWKLNNHATTVSSRVVYRTPGPFFVGVATAKDIDRWLPSERLGLESKLGQKALQIVQEQVREHNAAVQAIDNGPDDRVYLAETGHRVAEAVKATCEGKPDSAELEAACRANLYAADIVIANFNHHNRKD